MPTQSNVQFVDTIARMGAAKDDQVRRLNACLAEATKTCGDVVFGGTAVRIEVYHVRRFESGSEVDWHSHPFMELTLVDGGPIAYEYAGGPISVGQGEVFLMPAFTPHRWRLPTGQAALHGFMLTVRPVADRGHSWVPRLAAAASCLGYRLPSDPETATALLQTEEEASRGDAFGIEAAAGHLRVGLARLFRRIVEAVPADASPASTAGPATLPAAVERAVAFIANHLAEPLDVPAIARHVRLSTRQLDRLFRATFDMPAGAFLLHNRFERARYLLSDSDLSIKQVAGACGFTDPNYFSRTFRKRHGQSPGAYRGCR